ncbi:MAG: DUF1993 domain-containing protein [Aestuariivirgaceae bacterium]|nr:DUF1993 domain-containing protein [Aestuariivirgaceae bacterium]
MSFDIYTASIPAFLNQLNAMGKVLDKAAAHAEARKIDPLTITAWRLAPDMLTMGRQVQIMCDFAKGAAARLAGQEVPKWADDEKTIDELKARIAKTIAFVESFKPEHFADAPAREVVMTVGGKEWKFTGAEYLTHFVLPNFYFHASIAYANLRNLGVELGKMDFIGRG